MIKAEGSQRLSVSAVCIATIECRDIYNWKWLNKGYDCNVQRRLSGMTRRLAIATGHALPTAYTIKPTVPLFVAITVPLFVAIICGYHHLLYDRTWILFARTYCATLKLKDRVKKFTSSANNPWIKKYVRTLSVPTYRKENVAICVSLCTIITTTRSSQNHTVW